LRSRRHENFADVRVKVLLAIAATSLAAAAWPAAAQTPAVTLALARTKLVGAVTMRAAVAGEQPAAVDFLADGRLVDVDQEAPFVGTWASAAHPNGSVVLTARAVDATGAAVDSPPVPATVANAVRARPRSVLRNGSFERTTRAWRGYRSQLVRVAGARGRYAARAIAKASGTFSITAQAIPALARRVYTATALVRGAPGEQVCLRVREFRRGGSFVDSHHFCVTADGSWQQLGPRAYLPRAGRVVDVDISSSGQKGASFDVDAVTLVAG
jgi:hypothetical protein